jgi:branched-chain amino acid transport system permease protein
MSIEVAYNTFVSAMVLGVIYALVALGYVVVYRASRVFNFVHPLFMLFGALLFTTLWSGDGLLAFALAALVATLVISAFGGILYIGVVHRSVGQPHWVQMVLTMGLGIAGLNLAQLFWGPEVRFIQPPWEHVRWQLPGGAILTRTDLILVIIGIVLCGVLYWLLTVSSLGVRLRATAENATLASYSGIRLGLWFGIAWGLAAAAAVVAGVAYSLRVPLDPSLADIGLIAFPAAMIGGMDSIEGCFVGALILGIIQQYSNVLWGVQASTAVTFAAVLVILFVRPRGLFGAPIADRV